MSWTYGLFVVENSVRIYGISKGGGHLTIIFLMPVVLGHEVVGIVAKDGPDIGQFPLCHEDPWLHTSRPRRTREPAVRPRMNLRGAGKQHRRRMRPSTPRTQNAQISPADIRSIRHQT